MLSVFIDAEYVIQSLRGLNGKPRNYRIGIDDIYWDEIIRFLARKRDIRHIYYYSAQLDREENPETFQRQQCYLEATQCSLGQAYTTIRLGKMLKVRTKTKATWDGTRTNKIFGTPTWVQKGIDVKIVLDMLMGAFNNEYDTAILIAGDSDFAELLEILRTTLNKTCELVTFDRSDSRIQDNLVNAASSHVVIDYKTGTNKFWRVFEHRES